MAKIKKMSPQKKKLKSQSIREPEFGQRVKAVRKHLKLKQTKMAEKLGEFYRFFNSNRQTIDMDIESIKKEKSSDGKGLNSK